MGKNNESTLKEAIEELLKTYGLDNRLKETKVVAAWEKLMGKMISARTREIYVREGILYLKLDSAPLREELKYGKSRIIKLLNEEAGGEVIKDVIFS